MTRVHLVMSFPLFYYSPSHIYHEAPQQHTAGSAGLLRAAHPTTNTHTARARRVTGANVGSPGNSTELSQHETQISNITYYNNCCPPVIPPVIFQTTECCRKAPFGGAILSPFFLSIAEKRFLTSSLVRRFFLFYSPNVAGKVFFAQNQF